MENILTEEELNNVLEKYEKNDKIKFLRTQEHDFKKLFGFLVCQKHHFERLEDFEKTKEIKEEIKKVKKYRDLLNKKIIENSISEEKRKKNKSIPVFLKMESTSLSDLKSISYMLDLEEINKINLLSTNLYNYDKLMYLEELIAHFEQILVELKEKLNLAYSNFAQKLEIKNSINNKKIIKNSLNLEKYASFKVKIDYYQLTIGKLNRILERLYTLKGICKVSILKSENKENNKDIFEYSGSEIILNIVDNNTAKKIKDDLDILYSDALEEEIKTLDSLNYVTKVLSTSFQTLKDEDIVCVCNVMNNLITSKINELKSYKIDDFKEYIKELRTISKQYVKVKKQHLNDFKEQKLDVYYDLFMIMLANEKNYYYIDRIFDTVKYNINSYSVSKLLEKVIDEFILNYKLKIANQKFEYKDPKYYLSLFKLFTSSFNLEEDEIKNITYRLEEFREYLISKKVTDNRNEALMDLELLQSEIKINEKEENLDLEISNTVKERMEYLNKKNTCNKAFVIGNFAYSIDYTDEGDTYFKIHLLDSSNLILENSLVNDKLKKNMLLGNSQSFELPYLENKDYPVITFQYRIYKNNLSNLKIYENNIHIDNIYNSDDMNHYRDIPSLKELVSSYKRLRKSGNVSNLDKYTSSVISDEILTLFKNTKKEIPCMYKRTLSKQIQDTKKYNHNDLCNILFKIDKKTAHKIFNILDETPEDIYTNYITDESYLEFTPFNYQTIYLYRCLKEVLNDTYDFSENYEDTKKEVISYCKKLNENYGYVSDQFYKNDYQKTKK